MEYVFLNETFNSMISGGKINKPALEKYIAQKNNSFIMNHNIDAIAKFIKFIDGNDKTFILNGFMGAGKTYIADALSDFISDEVIVCRASYEEAINLDDIFLSIFKDFSQFYNKKRMVLPKVESSIFTDKINAYVKYSNFPMVFVFDSFEINMRSKDNQKDILDFITYLSHFDKVKIVICSRSFKESDLISNEGAVSCSLSSLSKEEVFAYLQDNSIDGSNFELEEFYKVSRGHFLLLELSVLIIKLLDISLNNFFSEYTKSAKNFLDFLISKIISVSSDKFVKLMILLALIRHGLSEEFLIGQNIATKEDLKYLLQKRLICEKFGQYYLKDYVKKEYVKSISIDTKMKVHEHLMKMYDSELPLKPFERRLFLSRQTMRQEIAYHEKMIKSLEEQAVKAGKQKRKEVQDFNYLSYSKNSGYDAEADNEKTKRYLKNIPTKTTDKRTRFELSQEDSIILNSSADVAVSNQNSASSTTKSHNPSSNQNTVPHTLADYLEIAQEYENEFNFSSAILHYKKALTFKSDEMYLVKEPIIYTKLAICYKKVQDTEEAVKMYEKVYELYLKDSVDKADSVLLSIAQIYNELYKFDKAKEIYRRILYSPYGVSPAMVVKVYLDLSELEDNNLDIDSALSYAQKALLEAEKLPDIKLLAECYFKYALLLDDTGSVDLAQKYYLRCIQTSNDAEVNQFLSSAYSNLAGISYDNNNLAAAKSYYELAVEVDKKLNNFDGLYYSYSKLANLYRGDSSSKRYEYLVKALSAAKRFDDITYAVSVYIEIGEYYFDTEDYKRALKSYILAKTLLPSHNEDEINAKINKGIGRIKSLLGEVEYSKLMNEIKKKN